MIRSRKMYDCRYCGWSWFAKKRVKRCAGCGASNFDDINIALDPYYIAFSSYKRILRNLEPGQSVLLPWILKDPKDYPDLKMLSFMNLKKSRLLYDSVSTPSGLRVTRKISPQ